MRLLVDSNVPSTGYGQIVSKKKRLVDRFRISVSRGGGSRQGVIVVRRQSVAFRVDVVPGTGLDVVLPNREDAVYVGAVVWVLEVQRIALTKKKQLVTKRGKQFVLISDRKIFAVHESRAYVEAIGGHIVSHVVQKGMAVVVTRQASRP